MSDPFYSKNFRLGILGGGQLGRMFIQEAVNYDVRVAVLDPSADAPCAQLAHEFVLGNFADFETVYNFGKTKDVVTIEIEHVNVEALEQLQKEGVKVYPRPDILSMVKDKGLQKQFYRINTINTAPFHLVSNRKDIEQFLPEFPFMQKIRTGGYDGRGVTPLKNAGDIANAFDAPSVLEKFVDFEREISVIIARNASGQEKTFPIVGMDFNPEANLVEYLYCPVDLTAQVEKAALEVASRIVRALDFVGILAVEMFVTKSGEVLVNEIAPRPHNSGHHTIEACITSQYEQHLRAILDLPLGDTTLLRPAVMVNILGARGHSGPVVYEHLREVMSLPGVFVHLYGKSETRPFRKMGHVTVIAETLDEATATAREVSRLLQAVSGASHS